MRFDLTNLTFLADPMTYQSRNDEVSIRVPEGISFVEDLMTVFKERLGLPDYLGSDPYDLRDAFGLWYNSEITPARVAIVHTDLPLLHSGEEGRYHLDNYLRALRESVTFLESRNATQTDPQERRELVAIFPERTKADILAVLNRPPDWQLSIGPARYDDLKIYQLAPRWSAVSTSLTQLNGLTAEMCSLSRSDVGRIDVQYMRSMQSYCIYYESADRTVRVFASPQEQNSFPPVVPFALASEILNTFFHHLHPLESLSWLPLSSDDLRQVQKLLERSYYQNEEEMLLEPSMGEGTYLTIGEGVKNAAAHGDDGFSLLYWQGLLEQAEIPLGQRLAAMCVVGRSSLSGLPNAASLLRPFLQSPVKQERWVSARFFGFWGDEAALPILLSMLSDEFPSADRKEGGEHESFWYDTWRLYAPRLLRKWQTPEVTEYLRRALATWVEAEPRLDPEVGLWERHQREICYELGYRGDLSALRGLSFDEEDEYDLQFKLKTSLRDGQKVREKGFTSYEEYLYRQSR